MPVVSVSGHGTWPWHRPSSWTWALELLAVFALAVVVRWPLYATIPAPTDETDELLWALRMVRDGSRPLTASDPYIGPLCTWLTALAFFLSGPSFEIGRAVALVLGALTAPATWLLGRWLAGPGAGLASGLLLAVAFGPVVMSHVAWSHGSAPALVALGLAFLVGATAPHGRPGRTGEPTAAGAPPGWRKSTAAGFCLALAVAAHPTVACFLPGVALWWLWQRRRSPRNAVRQVGWLLAGAAAGYAPGLLYAAAEGVGPFHAALAHREYVAPSLSNYGRGVWLWLASLARNLTGPAVHVDGVWLCLGLAGVMLASLLPWRRLGRGRRRIAGPA